MQDAESKSQVARLRIDGELTVCRATEHKRMLLKAIDQCNGVELDLSNVADIDTAGVQLLMLVKLMAKAKGGALLLPGPSAAVLELFEMVGLSAHFHDSIVPPSACQDSPMTGIGRIGHAT